MALFNLNYIHYLLLIFVIAVTALLFLLTNNQDELLGEPMIIDNLTSESNQRWVFFTDRVMGGISSGSLKLIEEEGDKFYKMTGDVSTKNNGGFIQFRADLRGMNLKENDFRGDTFANTKINLNGNNDILNITKKEVIHKIHMLYLESGADIIETNTFNSTMISQKDYNCEDYSYELNYQGGMIAR